MPIKIFFIPTKILDENEIKVNTFQIIVLIKIVSNLYSSTERSSSIIFINLKKYLTNNLSQYSELNNT